MKLNEEYELRCAMKLVTGKRMGITKQKCLKFFRLPSISSIQYLWGNCIMLTNHGGLFVSRYLGVWISFSTWNALFKWAIAQWYT